MMRRAQPWLGTLVEITVADKCANDLLLTSMTQAFAQIALVHRLMSFHDAASDVSRINRAAAGEVISIDPHTYRVLQLAQDVTEASDGIFSIGCAPKLVEWEYLPMPDTELPPYMPGHPLVELAEGGSVTKIANGWIDLGGIAKGYAVDLAIQALETAGIDTACVNAGGDMRAIGGDFPVLIRAPENPTRAGAELALRDEALATSATYFTAKEHGGLHTSALIDARTGQPIAGTVSASVRAPACAIADALTKVVLATGKTDHSALRRFEASAFII